MSFELSFPVSLALGRASDESLSFKKDRPGRERTCCWLAGQAIEDHRFPFSELVQDNGDLIFKVIPYESSFATCSDCHIGYGIEPIALSSPEFSRELEHLGKIDGCGVLINFKFGYITIGPSGPSQSPL